MELNLRKGLLINNLVHLNVKFKLTEKAKNKWKLNVDLEVEW
jgi:hypothetical protein